MPYKPKHENSRGKISDSKTILIGEDDIDDEELLKELFNSVDPSISLTFINNGKNVLDFLTGAPDNRLPSLIILDYNMPGLTGADILSSLKINNRYSAIPKIIWSTSQADSFKKKCLELGANDYIIKPSKVSELVDTIRYMISFC